MLADGDMLSPVCVACCWGSRGVSLCGYATHQHSSEAWLWLLCGCCCCGSVQEEAKWPSSVVPLVNLTMSNMNGWQSACSIMACGQEPCGLFLVWECSECTGVLSFCCCRRTGGGAALKGCCITSAREYASGVEGPVKHQAALIWCSGRAWLKASHGRARSCCRPQQSQQSHGRTAVATASGA